MKFALLSCALCVFTVVSVAQAKLVQEPKPMMPDSLGNKPHPGITDKCYKLTVYNKTFPAMSVDIEKYCGDMKRKKDTLPGSSSKNYWVENNSRVEFRGGDIRHSRVTMPKQAATVNCEGTIIAYCCFPGQDPKSCSAR